MAMADPPGWEHMEDLAGDENFITLGSMRASQVRIAGRGREGPQRFESPLVRRQPLAQATATPFPCGFMTHALLDVC